MIFVSPAVTNLDIAAYFSTKRTDIPVLKIEELGTGLDTYCACLRQCVPCLKVFTDEIGSDFWKNDKYLMFINTGSAPTVTNTITNLDTGDVTTVTDGTYGSLTLNTSTAPYYYTYTFEFFKIWQNLGYGRYQFDITVDNGSGTRIKEIKSPCFELMKFYPSIANGTIRIETVQSGKMNNGNNYGTGEFAQQLRLPGRLMYSGDVQQNDDLQLSNNQRSLIQIKDQTFPEYQLQVNLVSAPQIIMPLFDYLFANEVKISDYSVHNFVVDPADFSAKQYKSLPLKRTATEFTPQSRAVRKTFTFTMEYFRKNIFKTNN